MQASNPLGLVAGQHDRIRNFSDYKAFLQADLTAHGLRRWRFHLRFRHPELHFQRVLRLVEYLESGRGVFARVAYAAARLRLARLSLVSGISIPPGVFGRGLSIAHYGSIVVNNNARVGSFCRIHSATNIGIEQGKAPHLGDFVYVGPGAVISGGVTVGSRTAIGANAVVRRDIPEDSVAVGAPAKVVSAATSFGAMPEYIQSAMLPLMESRV